MLLTRRQGFDDGAGALANQPLLVDPIDRPSSRPELHRRPLSDTLLGMGIHRTRQDRHAACDIHQDEIDIGNKHWLIG